MEFFKRGLLAIGIMAAVSATSSASGFLVLGAGSDVAAKFTEMILGNNPKSAIDGYVCTSSGSVVVQSTTSSTEHPIFCVQDNAGLCNFRVFPTGKLGIGPVSPARQIHVHMLGASDQPYIQMTNGDTGATASDGFLFGLSTTEKAVIFNQENTDMDFYTNNNRHMIIKADGDIELTTSGGDVSMGGELSVTGISGSGKVVCIKADGNLGTCSDAVGAGGTCTCG